MLAVPVYLAVAPESPTYGLWPNEMTSTTDGKMVKTGSQYV